MQAPSRRPVAALLPLLAALALLGGRGEARLLGLAKDKLPTLQKSGSGGVGGGDAASGPWVEYLSWQPRAMLFHQFLSPEECDHLIAEAKPFMEKSTVVDSDTGQSKLDSVRTSSGTFLTRGKDEVIRSIEERIAVQTMLPVENGEGIQILRYNHGEKYSSHFDYFHDTINTANGGQRVATVLMYLSDVEDGGETVFPDSASKPNVGDPGFSACAQAGVAVKPRKGDALFFYSMTPGAVLDPHSLHGGCPVIRGAKWSATKWIRVNSYRI